MLIGYVSDENYVALADAQLEFENGSCSLAVNSRGSGAVHADIEPGRYDVVLSKPGFTAKRMEIDVEEGKPYQFRLLSDQMYGFMWPKWTRAGETAEYCVHSTEEFRLELWRYGWKKEFVRSLGWCSEHGPRAMAQITPDDDFTQTGVQWNRTGHTLEYQKHAVVAPEQSGLYFMHATTRSGEFISFPWIVMPDKPDANVAILTSSITSNAYNSFGGRSNYFNQDGLPSRPVVNSRQDLTRYTEPGTWPFEETG
ncbi:MAG: carboxypeptidase regulatory-like domain-containing protein, partial [Planctomycetaceae bacterium]|nr:carboxypeptidase regulatory-like domain-containing protein [Planctomycetaceae bacterium]